MSGLTSMSYLVFVYSPHTQNLVNSPYSDCILKTYTVQMYSGWLVPKIEQKIAGFELF